jgi:hypothetical protein
LDLSNGFKFCCAEDGDSANTDDGGV